MTTALLSAQPGALAERAQTDSRLIELWLHGRPLTTQRAYRRDVGRLFRWTHKGLRELTLADLQSFADSLSQSERPLTASSQARVLSGVKSLLTFGHSTGYLPVNVGAALRLPKGKNRLAERIAPESAVQRMLALESNPRNHALLRLLYGAGARVSEACALRWRDLQERGEAGQVTVYGKGGKTRAILLSPETWRKLAALRGTASPDDPVFRSRKGGALDTSQAWRIVKAAARRAGLAEGFSPHWLRHAHASHALDRGAPMSLVQATLGHESVATTGKYTHARPNDSSARFLPV
jgi:integrase/recombinase XerD